MLTIKRLKAIIDEKEEYQIFINDIPMGIIRNDEIRRLDLKDGIYKMYVKSSKMKSNMVEFNITSGSYVEFTCKPSHKGTIFSFFIHKVLKGNIGILLTLKQDIYL